MSAEDAAKRFCDCHGSRAPGMFAHTGCHGGNNDGDRRNVRHTSRACPAAAPRSPPAPPPLTLFLRRCHRRLLRGQGGRNCNPARETDRNCCDRASPCPRDPDGNPREGSRSGAASRLQSLKSACRWAPTRGPAMRGRYNSPMDRPSDMQPARAEPIRFTYEDYLAFPEDGRRHELIDGEHIVTPAPMRMHQEVLGRLFNAIWNHLEVHPIGKVYVSPIDVILSDTDVVQPDIVYVSNERRDVLGKWIHGAPDLAIEIVSPSSRRLDEVTKRRLFEKFGVRDTGRGSGSRGREGPPHRRDRGARPHRGAGAREGRRARHAAPAGPLGAVGVAVRAWGVNGASAPGLDSIAGAVQRPFPAAPRAPARG